MDMRRDASGPGPLVTGFTGHGFRVGDTVYRDGLILTVGRAIAWAAPTDPAALDADMLDPVLAEIADPPEFVLLGTGPRLVQPPHAFTAAIEARGIGVEAMDSRAAARAWGVLRQEDRRIVAALMPH